MRTVLESLLIGARGRPGLNDDLRNVVLITSPDRGDGKSTISTALAQSLVKLGKRVLLVDVDLRRGQLHDTLDVSGTNGLSDFLRGTAEGVAGKEIATNLTFLPCGTSTPNPSELLASSRMLAFVEESGRNYDVVLLDSPPLLPVTDASLLARYAAVKIIVARSQRTHLAACRHAAAILENLGYSVDGVILNDVKDTERSAYGYYSRDYYQGYAGHAVDAG